MIKDFFRLRERGTNYRTEILSGITTFMTMAYIIFVNPAILSKAGVPFAGAATATAVGAAVMCICMGLAANRPIAMASGMGLNAALTFTVIGFQQANVPWQVGMAVIFVEGAIIFLLVLTGLREAVMNAIPMNIKRAIGVGIGLFITVIGLAEGGIVRPAPVTFVSLGDFTQGSVWITLIGVFAILVFMSLRWKGSMLLGILSAGLAAMCMGMISPPSQIAAWPDFSTFFAPFARIDGTLAIMKVFSPVLLMAVFAIMLTDFFDTMGTVVAVGEQAGFVDSQGRVPEIRRVLVVDSLGAMTGGLFGASSVTSYIESSAGVADGGKTGLMPVVTGLLFAVAAFFTPLVAVIGGGCKVPNSTEYILLGQSGFTVPADNFFLYPVTAGALIVVGFLMMKTVRDIPWDDFEESFPAFLTIIGIPMTYSISHGIGFGFISHVVIKALHGKARQVHPLMYVVSAAFVAMFLMPLIEKLVR